MKGKLQMEVMQELWSLAIQAMSSGCAISLLNLMQGYFSY